MHPDCSTERRIMTDLRRSGQFLARMELEGNGTRSDCGWLKMGSTLKTTVDSSDHVTCHIWFIGRGRFRRATWPWRGARDTFNCGHHCLHDPPTVDSAHSLLLASRAHCCTPCQQGAQLYSLPAGCTAVLLTGWAHTCTPYQQCALL